MTEKTSYAAAGVDIAEGQRALDLMKQAVSATYTPEVLSETGSFGGLFDALSLFSSMSHPVLVASTDGVGTKTKVAARLDRWDTIGHDIVNHCIDDILVQGARPLFFLDYVATAHLDAGQIAAIVGGAATACCEAGCVLIGGETAEMPGVYAPGAVDLVGTIVGVVDHDQLITGETIQPGDAILALPAVGLHTNGFTLARSVLNDLDWQSPHSDLGQSIGEALLAIHPSYLKPVQSLRTAGVNVRGLAHITGGGVYDNLPRILPGGLGATIRRGTWPEPPIFDLIRQRGKIDPREMFHVFNMGLGMLVVVPPGDVSTAQSTLPGTVHLVGQIVDNQGIVEIQNLGKDS
ncbi:MAG: phosphoribosylformylglycinamidine cyclo-ligase [Anaerolineae bacterium]|nr:phosphoribosylformylglycinamidine cyclo-ligase [Anaerolineae bacterium]